MSFLLGTNSHNLYESRFPQLCQTNELGDSTGSRLGHVYLYEVHCNQVHPDSINIHLVTMYVNIGRVFLMKIFAYHANDDPRGGKLK